MIGSSAGRLRQTLAQPAELYAGVGLHTGEPAALRFLPAESGLGLVFVDRTTGHQVPAIAANVRDTSRCTQLQSGLATIQTVEHVLAALAGLGVDDALIELDGREPPAADGGAAPYVELIRNAGIRAHGPNELAGSMVLSRPCFVSDAQGGAIAAMPAEAFSATVVLDYPNHSYIGTQAFSFDSATDDFARDVAPARTFGFISELDALRAHGLALGASQENAIALGDDRYETELRFPDELARHKLLDLIGDLALIGTPLRARLIAIKPGHALNTRLARILNERERS